VPIRPFPLSKAPDRHPAGPGLFTLAALCLFASCGAAVPERQAAETRPFVEASLPGSLDEVTTALRAFFNDGLTPPSRSPRPERFPAGDRLREFLLFPREVTPGYGFIPLPDDAMIRANTRDDPSIRRYLDLPPERRRHDLFLYRPLDVYWLSEYRVRGKPAPFNCHFILHLEPDGPGKTRIEVLEYRPMVKAGRKLRALAPHGAGPGFVSDLHLVPPTTRDRVELLERIRKAVAVAVENGRPSTPPPP
jgi:hypothetical protein